MAEESMSTMWSFMGSWFTPATLFLLLNLMIGTIVLTSRFTTHKNQPQQGRGNHPQLGRAPSLLDRLKSFDLSLYRSVSSEPVTLQSPDENLSSRLAIPENQTQEQPPSQLARAPSFLERVKSLDLSLYRTESSQPVTLQSPDETLSSRLAIPETQTQEQPPSQLARAPSFLDRVKSLDFSLYRTESSQPETLQSPDETRYRKPGPGSGQGEEHQVTRSKSETKPKSGEGPAREPEKMKKSASEKMTVGHSKEEEVVERRRPATVRERGSGRGGESASYGEDEGVDAKADDFIERFKKQLKLQRLDSLLRARKG